MDTKEASCHNYDNTVSFSREESIKRALELAQAATNVQQNLPLHRPKINFAKILLCNIIWLIVLAAVYWAAGFLPVSGGIRILLTVAAFLAISLINLRRIIITLVRIYQRYAPETLRRACVFEPSCSQYMIMAVEKYGAFKGVIKGINRLSRCHSPNSGKDYP